MGIELGVGKESGLRRSEAGWLEDFKLRRGSILSLQDQAGKWFRARVTELNESELRFKVFAELKRPVESGLFLILLQAIPNQERMELIIEKSVELGVDQIQPFFSRRSYGLAELKQKKWHRWQERARRAAEQSRRGLVPEVFAPKFLEDAVQVCGGVELKLVLYEGEAERGLREFLEAKNLVRSCALAVGPEGGWEGEEIEGLKGKGFVAVGMGGRILRVETAAITGVGMVQYILGDLGR